MSLAECWWEKRAWHRSGENALLLRCQKTFRDQWCETCFSETISWAAHQRTPWVWWTLTAFKERSHRTLVSVSETRTNVVPASLPQYSRDWSRVGRHRQCWWRNRCEFCGSPKFCAKWTGGIVIWNWRFSQRSLECSYSRRVLKVGECGNGIVFCPGSVGNHTCSPRQDEKQKRRQKWTSSLIFWKGQRKVAKTQLSQTFAGQVGCEKVEVNVSRVWTTWSLGWWSSMPWKSRHKISLLGQMINCFQIARTDMMVERIGQSGVFSSCSNLREHSVCTNSVAHCRCSLVDAHIPVSLVVIGTVHPTRSADSQEICRSVMEIFGTQCIQVRSRTGNHWHSLSFLRRRLRLVGKLQEFAWRFWSKTRDWRNSWRWEMQIWWWCYTRLFDQSDGSRFCCWQEGQNGFQRGSFETLVFVDWSRFSDFCQSYCGYGRKDAQDWNWRRWLGREPSGTLGVAIESARLAQRD